MNQNLFDNLPRPFWALAPMEDVTDVAFRQMFARHGRYKDERGNLRGPDVLWTEFTSADGLVKGGWDRLKHQLFFEDDEQPIVAQLFSDNSGRMRQAASICRELGFAAVGVNMCCPSRTVVNNGCGSALIRTPKLAQNVVLAAKQGSGLPVTVKTRLGFNEVEIESWVPNLLEVEPAVISIHARTRKEMSNVPADWEAIKRVREIRDKLNSDTLIVGNGDVSSLEEGERLAEETGVDGIMVGRAAFGNPWFFNPEIDRDELPAKIRLEVMVENAQAFDEMLPDQHFAIMRKHFKAYTKGLPQANALRDKLMQTKDSKEVKNIVTAYLEPGV